MVERKKKSLLFLKAKKKTLERFEIRYKKRTCVEEDRSGMATILHVFFVLSINLYFLVLSCCSKIPEKKSNHRKTKNKNKKQTKNHRTE